MTTRREMLIGLGADAFVPLTVLAQSKQPVLIGWLETGSRESRGDFLIAFKEGLAALGWKVGAQIVIEERWADGQVEMLPSLAETLKATKPAVIVTGGLRGTIAAAKRVPNTPIVQSAGTSPVTVGLAVSLGRPGGMVTGVNDRYLEI